MGFFSILSDISQNKSNFKQWEEKERDNDAKRKALYKKGVGKERLEEAKKRGDVIIDVITQMDQHSENFSEDIEQVTQPLTSLAGAIGALAGSAGGGYYFYKITEKSYKAFDESTKGIKEEAAKAIKKQIDDFYKEGINCLVPKNEKALHELYLLKNGAEYNNKIFKSKYLYKYKPYLSEESFKALKETYIPNYQKFWKNVKHHGAIAGTIAIATPILAYTLATLGTTKMQLDGSRIARWQSRNQLSDARNFVVFTPEQIAEAEEEVKKHQKPLTLQEKLFGKKDKTQAGFWKNWTKFFTDRKAYNAWKAQDNDDSKKVTRKLTKEEEWEAKLDQELIQRITKKINNKAEEYSEDMETASAVILGLPFVTGPLIGTPLSWVLEKTGIAQKLSNSVFNKNAPKGYKEFLKQQTANNAKKSRFQRFVDFFKSQEKLSELINEEKALKETGNKVQKTKNSFPLKEMWRRTKILASQTPAMRRLASWGAIAAVTSVVTMYLGLKLQKNAARAGRYIAREEFKDNPQEFLSYTDEEMQQVQDVKGTKPTLQEKFREWITFLPRCVKNVFKYENYKKTTYQKQKDVRDELVKSAKISDKQLLEAKNLQRKLFNTFEKVDEKSQSYSENMEAANELATPLIYLGGYALTAAPFIAIMIGVAKGKISVAKLGEWFTGLMTKAGGTKWAQKVQKEGVQSLSRTIERMPDEKINFGRIEELLKMPGQIEGFLAGDMMNRPIAEVIKNRYGYEDGLSNYLISVIKSAVENGNTLKVKDLIEKTNILKMIVGECIGTTKNKTLGKIMSSDKDRDKHIARLIRSCFPEEQIAKFEDKSVFDILQKLKIIDEKGNIHSNLTDKTVSEFLGIDLSKFDIEKTTIGEILATEGKNLIRQGAGIVKPVMPSREKAFEYLRNFVEKAPEATVKATLEKLSGQELGPVQMGTIDRQYIIRMLNRIEKMAEKSAGSGLQEEINKLIQTMMQNPQKTMNLLINNPEKLINAFKSETLAQTLFAAGVSWTAFTTIMTYCLASYFASMQKDAGRLGVMKSIEELQDYRYYADETPEGKTADISQKIVKKSVPSQYSSFNV